MADEELAIAPTEQAQPAIASEATTAPEVIEDDGNVAIPEPGEEVDEAPVAEAPPEDDDTEEVEWNGKTFKAPKGVKDGILMHADYTRKRQADAEKAKALDTRQAEIEQQAAATEDELRDRAVLLGVNAQLDNYKNVDWVTLWRTDPVAAGEHQARYQQLQQAAQEASEGLKTKQAERTQKAERELATRVEETLKFASEKGIKSEQIGEIVKFLEADGIPEEAIKRNWSPAFLTLAHKALIGHQTLAKQTAAPPRAPALPLKPLATVGGKSASAGTSDLASMEMDAYVAARRKGLGGGKLR